VTKGVKKAPSRRQGRELALHVLYAMDAGQCPLDEALAGYRGMHFPRKRALSPFARELLTKTASAINSIDAHLQSVIEHWRLNRVSLVDRNLLRLATAEILFCDDIPLKVTINEYIEIAKIYGDKDSPAFVNGILDKIAKTMSSKPLAPAQPGEKK
jgi:N utilization substance protein B